jgi:hypothetical protein
VKGAAEQIVDLINKLRSYLNKPTLSDPLASYLHTVATASSRSTRKLRVLP